MRHTALTELYEDPNVSEQTIRSIAGHVSKRMAEIYSHTRLDAKRKAIGALSTGIKPPTSPTRKDRHAASAAATS